MSDENNELKYTLTVKTVEELSRELEAYFKVQVKVLSEIKVIKERLDKLEPLIEKIKHSWLYGGK